MSLIDKDKTLDAISMYLFVNDAVRNDVKVGDYKVFAKSMICDVPEVDIVRCKECRWLDKGENESCSWSMCTRHFGQYIDVNADDYCSYGERSE